MKYFSLLALLFLSCTEEEEVTPIRQLITRAVVTTYRVDSMTSQGDRCGWYVFDLVDDVGTDSVYMCSGYKIGDTMRIHNSHDTLKEGNTLKGHHQGQ